MESAYKRLVLYRKGKNKVMKEILGENLQSLFDNEKLNGKRTYNGNEFEVWKISDETYKTLCDMLNDESYDLYPSSVWYYASGSNMGAPDVDYIINGQHINAWDGDTRLSWRDSECEDCNDYLEGKCNANDEDVLGCFNERNYSTLTEYFASELGAGLLRNVCSLATDLAKYNNMTLGELFAKFEGKGS